MSDQDDSMLLLAGQIAGLAMRHSSREWNDLAQRMALNRTFRYADNLRAVAHLRRSLGETDDASSPDSKEKPR